MFRTNKQKLNLVNGYNNAELLFREEGYTLDKLYRWRNQCIANQEVSLFFVDGISLFLSTVKGSV